MLFDFQSFVEELRENPEKKEIAEKYEKNYWKIKWDIKDQQWYKDYVVEFKTSKFLTPEDLEDSYDWDLLMQLIASSFSSDANLEYEEDNELPEFIISVQNGDQSVIKKISELWGYQISRLYEIFIEEQMNLQVLVKEDPEEKEAIITQRESRINRWNLMFDSMETEKLNKEEEIEKKSKLEDLYWKL